MMLSILLGPVAEHLPQVTDLIWALATLVTAIGTIRGVKWYRSKRPPPRPKQPHDVPVSLEPGPYPSELERGRDEPPAIIEPLPSIPPAPPKPRYRGPLLAELEQNRQRDTERPPPPPPERKR